MSEQAWRVLVGDVRAKLRELGDWSVHCVVTSPPYFGLRDYGHIDQIGREDTVDEYIGEMVRAMSEVRRVLTPSGTAWLNIGDSYEDTGGMKLVPHRLAIELMKHGWFVQMDAIWRKTRYMPNGGKSRPVLIHEYVFMLTRERRGYRYFEDAIREPHSEVSLKRWATSGVAKLGAKNSMGHKQAEGDYQTKAVIANPLGKLRASVWDICPSNYDGAHYAVMPWELAETCILASSVHGDTVLDPFTGSGTTGAVAVSLGRSFIGVELNPESALLAEKRIRAVMPLFA